MILPILMVIAGLLVGYVLFMLVICQFTKPRAPTFIDPNYIDPWVIVSRRRWGSPSWGGKYGDWHVVFYEDLLGMVAVPFSGVTDMWVSCGRENGRNHPSRVRRLGHPPG